MKNRIVRLLLLVVVFVSLTLWLGFSSKRAATSVRKFEPTAARLERGRYIVEGVAHCFECHSDVDWETPGGQPRQGRKGSGTEFAKYGFPWLVAPNITPDAETGAGTWTGGYFRNMTDDDLKAIFFYLRTLPPVQHRVDNTEAPTDCSLCGKRHGHGDMNR